MPMPMVTIPSKKRDVKFDKFVEDVLECNERNYASLTSNELAFLQNRYKEGKKADTVVI